MKGALLLVGYGVLIGLYGPWGVLAAVVHVAIMVIALPRRTKAKPVHQTEDAKTGADADKTP